MWSLLGFFSASPTCENGADSLRWKMIPALFTYPAGVFGNVSSTSSDHLPLSKVHIERASKEMQNFRRLLESRALHPLNDDTPLIRILQQALTLHSNSYSSTTNRSEESILSKNINRKDERVAFHCWEESSFHNPLEVRIAQKLHADSQNTQHSSRSLFQLSFNSPILQNCVTLISTWMKRMPNKKLRWRRLLQDSLQPFLKEVTSQFRDESRNDEFANFFSGTKSGCENVSNQRLCKLEVVGYTMVEVIISFFCIQVHNHSPISIPLASANTATFFQVRAQTLSNFYLTFLHTQYAFLNLGLGGHLK